jgi:hypothetical protein
VYNGITERFDPADLREVKSFLHLTREGKTAVTDVTYMVTGSMFLAGAVMWWLGWILLPAKIGAFFVVSDFAAVDRRFQIWIWLFRIHLFGHLVSMMALASFATLGIGNAQARVLVWPGTAVAGTGLVVASLAAAFYYHFGAWGALDLRDKPGEDARRMVDSLRVPTEYVTCLVRFGRVFFGLGQVVLAGGMMLSGAFPLWFTVVSIVLGVAAMALTMGLPDDLHLYYPLFHFNTIWLIAMGLMLWRGPMAS